MIKRSVSRIDAVEFGSVCRSNGQVLVTYSAGVLADFQRKLRETTGGGYVIKPTSSTPRDHRTSFSGLKLSRMPLAIAITTILFVLVTMNILGNSLVCAMVLKHRDIRTPFNLLILNLAVADALFAVFITPRLIVSLNLSHPGGLTGTILCKLITGGAFGWVAAVCSVLTLVAISVERYFAVLDPNGIKRRLTDCRVKVIITVAWVYAWISNIPTIAGLKMTENNYCRQDFPEDWMSKAYTIYVDVVLVLIPLLVMFVLYSRVLYALWVKPRNTVQPITCQQKGVIKVRKRITLMVVTVTVIFAICLGTIQVIYTLARFTSYQLSPVVAAISNVMVLFNSAVNPFMYALLNHNFRGKMKRMIRCSNVRVIAAVSDPQSADHSIN